MTSRDQSLGRPADGADLTADERLELSAGWVRSAQAATTSEAHRHALDRLVELNMPMALAIAGRYRNRGIPLEDLEQTACLALVLAAQRFDSGQSQHFLTFAVPTISGEVKKYFRDHGWMVRPPRSVQELQPLVERERARIGGSEHAGDLVALIAGRLGATRAGVVDAMRAQSCFAVLSLDTPVGDGPSLLGDLILTPQGLTEEAADARVVLAPALNRLHARERRIVHLRFVEGLTQREIAEILGLTQVQVSRLLARILLGMRATLTEGRIGALREVA